MLQLPRATWCQGLPTRSILVENFKKQTSFLRGKVFVGIPITSNSGTIASNSTSVPTTMAPPAPLPTKYDVLVEAASEWTDSRLTSFKSDFETGDLEVAFQGNMLTVHSMAPSATGKFIAQVRDGLDPDGDKWVNISRQACKATHVPHVVGSEATSIMDHKTEACFQAIEKTQESLKHELGGVKNSVRKLEEKIDENE